MQQGPRVAVIGLRPELAPPVKVRTMVVPLMVAVAVVPS